MIEWWIDLIMNQSLCVFGRKKHEFGTNNYTLKEGTEKLETNS